MTKVVLNESGGQPLCTSITLKSAITAAVGDLIGWNAGWVLADADAQIPAVFMAAEAGTARPIKAVQSGVLTDTAIPYTAGDAQYLSATVAEHTATIPAESTTLTVIQKVGVAISTSHMLFNLNQRGPTVMRITGAVDPASGDTDTVQSLAVTLTGVAATDYAFIASAPAVVQGVVYNGSLVCTTNTVTVGIANPSAGTVNGASTDVVFVIHIY